MTLIEYFEQLKELVEESPELHDATVVTSIDDEGNGYNRVNFGPSCGNFDGMDWRTVDDLEDGEKLNAICLN